jgi:hypothetical protein
MFAGHPPKKEIFLGKGCCFHLFIGCHGLPYLAAGLQSRYGIANFWKRDFCYMKHLFGAKVAFMAIIIS